MPKKDTSKYNTYIYKVLKMVHPDTGMNGEAMADMNALVHDALQMITEESNHVMSKRKVPKKTLDYPDIGAGVALAIPGELSRHAQSEGNKAVGKFMQSAKGTKGHPVSKSYRAGLQFPITRVENEMMNHSVACRKGKRAAVYLAAVLEYLVAEILELAGIAARDSNKVRISSRHIKLAIGNDEELSRMYKNTILAGGVIPDIHFKALPARQQKAMKKKM